MDYKKRNQSTNIAIADRMAMAKSLVCGFVRVSVFNKAFDFSKVD